MTITQLMSGHGLPSNSMTIRSAAGAQLLVVVGGDRGIVVTKEGRRGHSGATDLYRLLDDSVPFHEFHIGSNFRNRQTQPDVMPYRCILNLVTDPDQNPRSLENLRKLLRGFSGRVINRPEAVLQSTRDQVARQLAGIPDLHVPQVVRLRSARPGVVAQAVEKAGLQFPLIVRRAGTHTGNIVGCVDSLDALRSSLTQPGEHIAIEFVDFRSADGLYRKYRVFFIGGRMVLRHMLVSDDWNVHARDRTRFMVGRPELLEEENRKLANANGGFPVEVLKALRNVRERIALDFFGMDFGIASDGRVVLFEANATMNFFPFLPDPRFDYVKRCLGPARRAFYELVNPSAAAAMVVRAAS